MSAPRYVVRPCDEPEADPPGPRARVWSVVDTHETDAHGEPREVATWLETRAEARARARELNAAHRDASTRAALALRGPAKEIDRASG